MVTGMVDLVLTSPLSPGLWLKAARKRVPTKRRALLIKSITKLTLKSKGKIRVSLASAKRAARAIPQLKRNANATVIISPVSLKGDRGNIKNLPLLHLQIQANLIRAPGARPLLHLLKRKGRDIEARVESVRVWISNQNQEVITKRLIQPRTK